MTRLLLPAYLSACVHSSPAADEPHDLTVPMHVPAQKLVVIHREPLGVWQRPPPRTAVDCDVILLVEPSGVPTRALVPVCESDAAADVFAASALAWRFEPFVEDGGTTPACFTIHFKYRPQ